MASVLIWKIQFVGSNPFGEFVNGDILDFYYDTTTVISFDPGISQDGISIKKNGVTITSGADISTNQNINAGVLIEQSQTNGVCNSGYFLQPGRSVYTSFPYVYNVYFANHSSCQVNPPTCDLLIVGLPTTISASSETTADGEINVVAQSSLPIQYKLNSDFTYNDGSGHQNSGTFNGLLPGSYVIYLRDSANCGANIQVPININNVYGTLFRLVYDDRLGATSRVDIVKRTYSSTITEVKGGASPWVRTLRGEGSTDKFQSILATEVVLTLTSETNFAFSTLYTNNPDDLRIVFYKNNVLKGIYKVLPQQYGEDYKNPPYYTYVKGTDGLPSLKDYVFLQDDGQRFNGNIKAIELISFILRKTNLSLNIRCGINMYATGMNTTDDDDPLDQAYVETDAYYINEAQPTLDYVLKQILEPFGARILQEDAVWNIVRVEELRGAYDYREFDPGGAYLSESSYNPLLNIVLPSGSNGFKFANVDHYMSLCPGYGKIRLFYHLGLRENILENGDFRLKAIGSLGNVYVFDLDTFGFLLVNSDYAISSGWEAIDDQNVAWRISGDSNITAGYGNAYIQSSSNTIKMGLANTLKISVRYKIPVPVAYGLTPIPINIPYQKVRIRVRYGIYYLLTNGTWSTTENFIIIYVTEYDKYLTTDLIATQPTAGASAGYDFEIRVYHSYIYHSEFTNSTDLKAKVTYSGSNVLPNGARSEYSALGSLNPLYYFELEENTGAESIPSIVRPNDYHATNNPRQWILKKTITKTFFTNFTSPFWVDFIKVNFLTNGTEVEDTIIREINAEPKNLGVLEKHVTHGSYQSIVVTIPQWDYGIGKLTANSGATLSLITTNVLSADILYAGYFRQLSGTGYSTWVRDGVAEDSSLHLILLQQYASQYKRSFRKLTGSFYSSDTYFTFLNVFREVNDGNRLYLPISPSIDDKTNFVNGEFLELIDITQAGEGSTPFSSGFTVGFGTGYN